MNNVTSVSKIKPMNISDFNKYTSFLNKDNSLDYSTARPRRVIQDAFDCTGCLISNDRIVLLKYLYPSKEQNSALPYLRSNLDLKEDKLQRMIQHSEYIKSNQDVFNKFVKLLDYLTVPTIILKVGKIHTNTVYRTCKDEVIMPNVNIDKTLLSGQNNKDVINPSFEEVKISECDEV